MLARREQLISERACAFGDAPDARYLNAQTKAHYSPDRGFIPLRIRLDLKVDVKKKTAEGSCKTEIELIHKHDEWIAFDAVEMQIQKVLVNGKSVKFEYDKKHIKIHSKHIAQRGSVEIFYRVSNPPLGIFFIHPTKDQPHKPYQAWTHSEAQEARYWYPCQDQPETKCPIEMHITAEKPFKVIANGDLVGVKTKGNWQTYSWKFDHPNPSYLNAFMIGDFAEVKEKWGKVDILYYGDKGREEDLKRSFGKTPKMMQAFSEFTGYPYPHKKYAQIAVHDFIFGGMEHTTCTTQTEEALQDAIADAENNDWPETLSSHELAHQWFGDLITCKDWQHGWLNEGFARYFEAVWQEHAYGKDAYDYDIYENYLTYMDEDKLKYRRPIVTNVYMEPSNLFDSHLYEKGALMLHMLRGIVGKELFKKAIQYYVQKHAHQNVITEDLMDAFRVVTGKNLTQFMDQFLYQGGHPELKASVFYQKKEHKLVVRLIQTTQGEAYAFPLQIAVTHTNKKVVLETKQVNAKEHRFEFKLDQEPLNVVIDPENYVLKNLSTQKPRRMWQYQLQHDTIITQRILAAQEIARYASPEDLRLLNAALRSDESWRVRGNVALAFIGIRLPQAGEMLLHAYGFEKMYRVKRTIIMALSEHKTPEVREFLLREAQRQDSYLIPAESYRALGMRKDPNEIQILEQGMKRDAWYDVIRTASISGFAQLQSEEAYRRILQALHPKNSNFVRLAACKALANIGRGRDDTQAKLVEAANDPYILVQIYAISSLAEIGDARVIPELEKLTKGHRDPRVKRGAVEAIRKINGGIDLPKWKEEKKDEE
ncbi:MAG: HEAT repeat domain-containing protein [Candidatus Iainarchaeum archaeon]|uniref:HEAT repeat domain-containing protein n=1 Tax=Candidatus Iainarchaeum sp. TaxID=3101447 RepID=A0A7T9DJA0_9ARCH|nr:MAG: HEAT repeat domain-containing protein [Candidatus Diapherotrites archaeon]